MNRHLLSISKVQAVLEVLAIILPIICSVTNEVDDISISKLGKLRLRKAKRFLQVHVLD